MKFKFNHFNFNVLELNKSIKFYEDALGLKEIRRKEASDGSFILFHLAVTVDDYEESFKKHEKMGCIEYVNESMGIYFITDPDGYWTEVVPVR
ncbi:MAG: lactoylglutathione lyase [Sedimentibacter sp.]|nr:lactoylglutathione lyase [Sedimentibacter sp.]